MPLPLLLQQWGSKQDKQDAKQSSHRNDSKDRDKGDRDKNRDSTHKRTSRTTKPDRPDEPSRPPTTKPPSKHSKRSQSTSRSSTKSAPPSTALVPFFSKHKALVDLSQVPEEVRDVCNEAERKHAGSGETVVAVINQDMVPVLADRLRKMRKSGQITSNVLAVHPEALQAGLDALIGNGILRKLHLVVHSGITDIAYKVSEMISSLHVTLCGDFDHQNVKVLRIGSTSTYGGWRAYAWHKRPPQLARHELLHSDGVYFDPSDDMDTATQLIGQPSTISAMRAEDLNPLKTFISNLLKEVAADGDKKSALTSGALTLASDLLPAWWQNWRSLVAAVLGGPGTSSTGGALFWFDAAGVCIKGALGFQLSVLGAGAGGFAVVGPLAIGSVLAAGAVMYFVPWTKIFQYLKARLFAIWDVVRELFAWVWKKLKEMTANVFSSAK